MISSIIVEVRGGIVQQVNQYFHPEAKGGIYVLDWDNDDIELTLPDGTTAPCSFEEMDVTDVKATDQWSKIYRELIPQRPTL